MKPKQKKRNTNKFRKSIKNKSQKLKIKQKSNTMKNTMKNGEMVKEVTNSENQFQPSNEWFEEYRKSSIDCYIMDKIKDVIKETKFEMIECLSDVEFLRGNFPSYSKIEMENYIKKEYVKDSVFINKLKSVIKSEGYYYEKNSEEEKDWVDEYLSFNPQPVNRN